MTTAEIKREQRSLARSGWVPYPHALRDGKHFVTDQEALRGLLGSLEFEWRSIESRVYVRRNG